MRRNCIRSDPPASERQKAARGRLRLPLPAGLVHNRDGSVTFNPDEEVQGQPLLVFAKFRELRSAKAVMRYLRGSNLLLQCDRYSVRRRMTWFGARLTVPAWSKSEEPGLCWCPHLWPTAPGPAAPATRQ